ncbi:MAG: hypothetical protein NDJ18_01330 [candidate division Zixibacteria bacterium]|nr:hypothetical protein [candidate division Zixibacteria bacterium]
MKFFRLIAAILLTAALLVIASRASRGKPEFVSYSENGYTLSMTTVPKFAENSKVRLDVTITGDLVKARPILRYARSEQQDLGDIATYRSFPMIQADSTTGAYFAELSTGARGGRIQYFIEIADRDGEAKATFTGSNGKPFFVKYFGEVPPTILISHIAFMFATVYCVAMASLHSLSVIRGTASAKTMLQYLLAAVVMTLIGGYPLGFAMNWYAFGGIWEGVPFGTDATDNKTQLLFVYLIFATVIGLGTLSDKKCGRDIFRTKAIGWFGLGALIVMLLIYLIPHSIQFSRLVTYSVCYTFIGFWALVYLIGWLTSRHTVSELKDSYAPRKVIR